MEIRGGNIISQIKRLSDRIFERILSQKNIDAFNGAQGRILYVLWQEEYISLRELADRACRDHPDQHDRPDGRFRSCLPDRRSDGPQEDSAYAHSKGADASI